MKGGQSEHPKQNTQKIAHRLLLSRTYHRTNPSTVTKSNVTIVKLRRSAQSPIDA